LAAENLFHTCSVYDWGMSFAIWLGIGAAGVCALVGNLAAIWKYKAVQDLPSIQLSRPWYSACQLFSSRPWVIGFSLAFVGFAFNAAALFLAPLSLVKPVLAGGIVLLAVVAERMLGVKPGPKQLLALFLAGGGLVLFAVTSEHTAHVSYSGQGLRWFELSAVIVAVFAVLGGGTKPALFLGFSAGVLMGAADAAVKQMGNTSFEQWFEGPAFYALLGALAALLIASKALQVGEAIGTVAIMGVVSNATSTLAGYVVFGDHLPQGAWQTALHLAAVCMLLLGVLLVPGPIPEKNNPT